MKRFYLTTCPEDVTPFLKTQTYCFSKKFRFTPCKAEQPLQGMELQEKEAQKD